MGTRSYPDHPLDEQRALDPIPRERLLELVEPGCARDLPGLLAIWRAMAPRIRELFPLPYGDGPLAGSTVLLPGETAVAALERVKRGTVVSIGVRKDFGSIDAIDYQGDPTGVNNEWPWQLNRLNGFWDLLAWGSERGDAEARAALLATVRNWLAIPVPLQASGYASMAHRTIDTGIRLARAFAQSLPTLLEHGDDGLLADLLASLFLQQERLRWNHRTNNWLTMEMNGLLAATACAPFNRRTAEYRDYAIGMMHASLAVQLLPDRMQVELSPSYHMVCVWNFMPLVRCARQLGIADERLDEIEATALDMVRQVSLLTLSTGELACPQDSTRLTLNGLRRYCPDLPAPSGSSILPDAGYAVLRQGGASVFFDAGPYGAAHQHQDKLNVVFTSGDRLGLVEYGIHTYERTIWRSLCLGSGGHNCLLVDGTGQWRSGAEERLPRPAVDLALREDATGSSVLGRYDERYGEHFANLAGGGYRGGLPCIEGVVHERAVHLLSAPGFAGCLLVEDRVVCSEERRLTLLWHLNSRRILAELADGLAAEIADAPFAVRWASDRPARLAHACGRHGEAREHFLDGTPAGWTNMLRNDMSGGPVQPCLRLEIDVRAASWRCATLFAFDTQAEALAVDPAEGVIRLRRRAAQLAVPARLG